MMMMVDPGLYVKVPFLDVCTGNEVMRGFIKGVSVDVSNL